MKITPNIPPQVPVASNDKPVVSANRASSEGKPNTLAYNDDSVSISKAAVDMSKVAQGVSNAEGIDREKIEAVKAALQYGDYPFDANRIAEKIISMEGLLNS